MSTWRRSIYFTVSLCALISCAGIAGGIYLGNALAKSHAPVSGRLSTASKPLSWLKFADGDAFPLETCWDSAGVKREIWDMISDRKTIVVFVSWDCGPCLDLLRSLHTTILGRLRPDVQVLLAVDSALGPVPVEYAGLIRGTRQLFIDGANWQSRYHVVFWPTIIGVDDSGIVTHVQFGFDGYIDPGLVEEFFSTH